MIPASFLCVHSGIGLLKNRTDPFTPFGAVSQIVFGLGKDASGRTNFTGEMVRRRHFHVPSFAELGTRKLRSVVLKVGDSIRNCFTFVSFENLKSPDFGFRQIRRCRESDALPEKRSLG